MALLKRESGENTHRRHGIYQCHVLTCHFSGNFQNSGNFKLSHTAMSFLTTALQDFVKGPGGISACCGSCCQAFRMGFPDLEWDQQMLHYRRLAITISDANIAATRKLAGVKSDHKLHASVNFPNTSKQHGYSQYGLSICLTIHTGNPVLKFLGDNIGQWVSKHMVYSKGKSESTALDLSSTAVECTAQYLAQGWVELPVDKRGGYMPCMKGGKTDPRKNEDHSIGHSLKLLAKLDVKLLWKKKPSVSAGGQQYCCRFSWKWKNWPVKCSVKPKPFRLMPAV